MKNETYSIFTTIFAFLMVLLLSFIPKISLNKSIIKESYVNNSIKTISSSIGDNYLQISREELNSDIVNVVYEDIKNETYRSFFIDKSTGRILDDDVLFKNGFENQFKEIELKLLNEKYPKFVVNGIIKTSTKREMFIKDNSLVIKYSNVITDPVCNENFSLIINLNEIKDIITFKHDLDKEYKNESGYDYDPTKKYIAFTFDDGPNKANTNDIVNFLNDNKMRATFFMVGNLMMDNPDIVKNVYNNNMEIGSHSWAHNNLKRQKIDDIKTEMSKTDEVYKNITGSEIKLMRPPYGAINDTVKDTFAYSFILWNVDTLDWKFKDSDHLYDFIVNNVEDGDIVLMHDLQYTTKVGIEKILPQLYANGFRVVSVSELAKIKKIDLNTNEIYRGFN